MSKTTSKLGKNIKDLRKAHNETQAELGEAIGVEHNTISTYESGRSQPDLDLLKKIAARYGYPIDQLIRADFSSLDFSDVNFSWENMITFMFEIMFPIACSDTALKDPYFEQGYEYTRKIINDMQTGEGEVKRNVFEMAIDEYSKSVDESGTMESAANILWLIYVLFSLIQVQDEHSIRMGRKIKRGEVTGTDFIKDYMFKHESTTNKESEANKKLFARDMNECISECMGMLKSSSEYANLADYYLALKYIIGMVDTDYGQDTNKIIGMEMMLSFLSLGNPYAFDYVDKSLKA